MDNIARQVGELTAANNLLNSELAATNAHLSHALTELDRLGVYRYSAVRDEWVSPVASGLLPLKERIEALERAETARRSSSFMARLRLLLTGR